MLYMYKGNNKKKKLECLYFLLLHNMKMLMCKMLNLNCCFLYFLFVDFHHLFHQFRHLNFDLCYLMVLLELNLDNKIY